MITAISVAKETHAGSAVAAWVAEARICGTTTAHCADGPVLRELRPEQDFVAYSRPEAVSTVGVGDAVAGVEADSLGAGVGVARADATG